MVYVCLASVVTDRATNDTFSVDGFYDDTKLIFAS